MHSPTSHAHLSAHTDVLPLSPRQEFQSRIRTFNGRPPPRQIRSESEVATLSRGARRSYELQHVSTLRVQHKRREIANNSPTPRAPLSETSYNVQGGLFRPSPENNVPDFSAEERVAWSKKSPKTGPPQTFELLTQPVFAPPSPRLGPLPQPSKLARQPSLRQFEPLQTETSIDERPRTSRGPRPPSPRQASASVTSREDEPAGQVNDEAMSRRSRRAKFLEGSMNDRSAGIASSWLHNTTPASKDSRFDDAASSSYGTDTDSDATPRVSQQKRESGSLSEEERKPLPPTPATTKRNVFRFGGNQRGSEDSTRPTETEVKNTKQRKGLRKSISMWNFHGLADKMNIFGGARSDTASETSNSSKPEKGKSKKDNAAVFSTLASVDVLNERKRKADEAYAQQFGVKKQKSNVGQSLSSAPAPPPTIGRTTKKTTSDTPTITPKLFRRKRDSYQSETVSQDYPPILRTIRKSPSKRDLEKENQQLRTMLKESQVKKVSRSASLSSLHLPPTGQENLVSGPFVMVSPGKGRRGEDIPPVPKVPDSFKNGGRQPLAEAGKAAGLHKAVVQSRLNDDSAKETIEEETGVKLAKREISEPTEPKSSGPLMQEGPETKEVFEWPDDVF